MLRDTAEAVDRELRGVPHEPFRTHDLPIPDCCNVPVRQVMRRDSTHVLFVEEDVVPPIGALKRLLEEDAAVGGIDYPLRQYPSIVSHLLFQKDALWVGLGFTLVQRKVFEVLGDPWFQTDLEAVARHSGSASNWKVELRKRRAPYEYGGHDITFCVKAYLAGFRIVAVSDLLCWHKGVILE